MLRGWELCLFEAGGPHRIYPHGRSVRFCSPHVVGAHRAMKGARRVAWPCPPFAVPPLILCGVRAPPIRGRGVPPPTPLLFTCFIHHSSTFGVSVIIRSHLVARVMSFALFVFLWSSTARSSVPADLDDRGRRLPGQHIACIL